MDKETWLDCPCLHKVFTKSNITINIKEMFVIEIFNSQIRQLLLKLLFISLRHIENHSQFWLYYIPLVGMSVFLLLKKLLYPPQRSCRGGILVSPCPSICRQILCCMITWVVFLRMFWNFISSLPVKRGGSFSFLTILTFAIPELLDLIWRKIGFLPYVVW